MSDLPNTSLLKERRMQEAIKNVILSLPDWPASAEVLIEKSGDLLTEIETKLQQLSLVAVVNEPDQLESVEGEATFNASSTWTISVFSSELLNGTGIDNLEACFLIRAALADTNPEGLWSEPLSRVRIQRVGLSPVTRDITFTAAYQS